MTAKRVRDEEMELDDGSLDFILEQELDEIPSYCRNCGKVHGPEACQYDDDYAGWDEEAPLMSTIRCVERIQQQPKKGAKRK